MGSGDSRSRYAVLAAVVALAASALGEPAGAASCSRSVERVEGGTWTMTPIAGIEGGNGGWRMDADPRDSRLVVVADSEGVLVSRDGGCKWERGVLYDDVAPEWSLQPRDVTIARNPRGGRVLHVLTGGAGTARVLLLSSHDDGRTWSPSEPPVEATGGSPAAVALASEPSRRGRLYLHVHHRTSTGALLASDDAGATWRWSAVTAFGAPPGFCLPSGACVAPPLLDVDAAGGASVWAAAAASSVGEPTRLVRSVDAGASWEDVPVPPLNGGPRLLEVVPGAGDATVLLLGAFGASALSRDGGATWEVGELPEVSSGGQRTAASHAAAHTAGGRTFAALLGVGSGPWSGNLMLFDGREWTNVAPDAYGGFGREDEDGNALFFTELTGGRESFSMLSSRGLLATFRPGR